MLNNDDNKQQLDQDGFAVVNQDIFPRELIARARQGVDMVFDENYDTGEAPRCRVNVGDQQRIQRITQIHMANKAIYELASYKKLGEVLATLTGKQHIRLWGTQLFYKPAHSGLSGHIGCHCDYEHVPYFCGETYTVWVPLSPISPEAGPLTYIPGSHRWKERHTFSGAQFQHIEAQRARMCNEHPQHPWAEKQALVTPGGFAIHNQKCLHYSASNETNEDRCAISIGILTEGSHFDSSQNDYGYAPLLDNPKYCPTLFTA